MNAYAWRVLLLAIGLAHVGGAVRADDFKIAQIEQDLRELKREVERQVRRIEYLESEVARSRATLTPPPGRAGPTSSDSSPAWFNIANWDQVKPGATELEVIGLLGPPSTLRRAPDGNSQTLLYAFEIGVGGFLVGSVTLIDKRVSEVSKPALQ